MLFNTGRMDATACRYFLLSSKQPRKKKKQTRKLQRIFTQLNYEAGLRASASSKQYSSLRVLTRRSPPEASIRRTRSCKDSGEMNAIVSSTEYSPNYVQTMVDLTLAIFNFHRKYIVLIISFGTSKIRLEIVINYYRGIR